MNGPKKTVPRQHGATSEGGGGIGAQPPRTKQRYMCSSPGGKIGVEGVSIGSEVIREGKREDNPKHDFNACHG